jgi:hypothetical protein
MKNIAIKKNTHLEVDSITNFLSTLYLLIV